MFCVWAFTVQHLPGTDAQVLLARNVPIHIMFTVNRDMGKATDSIVENPVDDEPTFPEKKKRCSSSTEIVYRVRRVLLRQVTI